MARSRSKKKAKFNLREATWALATKLMERMPIGKYARIALIVSGICIAGFGIARASQVVVRSVNAQSRYNVGFDAIVITAPPVWISADVLDEVRFLANLDQDMNVLDSQLITRLRYAFALHPWVKEVRGIEIDREEIQVSLTYREPVAVVNTTAALEPVDRDGVLLPGMLDHPEMYITVEGAGSTPTGPPGTVWRDPRVLAGARTAAALGAEHRELGLVVVDVSDFAGDDDPASTIFLVTNHGIRIKFGHSPDTDYPREPSVADKIARLRQLKNRGLIDQGQRWEIDITNWYDSSATPAK